MLWVLEIMLNGGGQTKGTTEVNYIELYIGMAKYFDIGICNWVGLAKAGGAN